MARRKNPEAQLPDSAVHITLTIGRGPGRAKSIMFFSQSVPLTSQRMKLVSQLIPKDQWKRLRPSLHKKATWEEIEAAASEHLAE